MMCALVGTFSFLNGMVLALHSASRIFELMLQMLFKTLQIRGRENLHCQLVVHPSLLSNRATEILCATSSNEWCPVCL